MKRNGCMTSFARGLQIGVALGRGGALSRADVMRLSGCSKSSAARYMAEMERLLAAVWTRGHGGGFATNKSLGSICMPWVEIGPSS